VGQEQVAEYDRNRYADPEQRAKRKAQMAENHKKVKSWVDDYKTQRGCIDCGINTPAFILELDHNGPKIFTIAKARSITIAHAEIQDGKCVVRCSNCHRIKTWVNKNSANRLVRGYVNKIKMVRGCLDCRYDRHPAALDFHHLDGKGQAISTIRSVELVDVELAMHPCIVLCSNCHRIRHEKEKQ